MHTITSVETLYEAIAKLEVRRRQQEQEIAIQIRELRDRLTPVNIIKNTFRTVVESSDLRLIVNMVSGYLVRKFFIRSKPGLLKAIIGALLQFGVTSLIRKTVRPQSPS